MDTIPSSLHRIQHNDSYTIFEPTHGFESRGHYLMGYSFWLNKGRLESHLIWSACPDEPSPFISAFDNLAEAETSAQHHVRRNTGVFLAEINTSSLQPTFLDIEFADRIVQLPAWGNMESITFISTRAVREHLGVQVSISQTQISPQPNMPQE